MKRAIAIACLLVAGVSAQDSVPSPDLWVGATPMVLGGYLQIEAEQRLDQTSGVFAQGRWWAGYTDGLVAGGQIAWRHHFRSLEKGFFIGPYLDVNRFEFDDRDGETVYEATIAVAGGHWGARYTFESGPWIGFRLGAGIPVMKSFDRKHVGNEGADAVLSFIDETWFRSYLVGYSSIDGALSLGWAF